MQTMTVLKAPPGLMRVEVRQAWVDVTMPYMTREEVNRTWKGTEWEEPDQKFSDQAYFFVKISDAITALGSAGKVQAALVWETLSKTGWAPYVPFPREFCKDHNHN